MGKATLLPYASLLAQKGFVSVLVDLPAQGSSGGLHIGYGYLEARYMKALDQYLYSRNLAHGQLILIGLSYGAAVALDSAALHLNHLSMVIAIAPFARIEPTVIRYARRYTDLDISASQLHEAISLDEKKLGYRFAVYSPLKMVSKIHVPVIYVAGENDRLTPLQDIKLLFRRTTNAKLIVEPDLGHVSLIMNTTLLRTIVDSQIDKMK